MICFRFSIIIITMLSLTSFSQNQNLISEGVIFEEYYNDVKSDAFYIGRINYCKSEGSSTWKISGVNLTKYLNDKSRNVCLLGATIYLTENDLFNCWHVRDTTTVSFCLGLDTIQLSSININSNQKKLNFGYSNNSFITSGRGISRAHKDLPTVKIKWVQTDEINLKYCKIKQ